MAASRVVWIEPYFKNEPVTCSIPVELAIRVTKHMAAKNGYIYESDEQALEDFLVVHWATVEE